MPVLAGVDPDLPGVVGATITGETTTVVFTGVVATVTKVPVFFTVAGVALLVAAALTALPPPLELPLDAAVHCATHVIAAAAIVTETPTPIVAPPLQLQPAKV